MESGTMGEWTFRVWGEAPALDADARHEVDVEITRLRCLIGGGRYATTVRVRKNPAGLLGEYVSLLLDATVRGRPDSEVLPAEVRMRYGEQEWFIVSLEVLEAFSEQLHAVQADDTRNSSWKRCHRRVAGRC